MIEQHQKPVKFRKIESQFALNKTQIEETTRSETKTQNSTTKNPHKRRERARFTHPGNKFSSWSNTSYTNFPEKNRLGEECENRSTMRKLEELRIEKNQSLSFILFYFIFLFF
ncbi:hypothetical protein PanWU01x14_264560 [Parasponia andersonii]|uniref:Uncharacterized protein n=1 Tax=Parasponia andersonii TaxID=3476 RepID=A0A2P5B7I5_PARAD|nr:hypothetical protein PanWU01x14_264560 [Parasponia andersonii]